MCASLQKRTVNIVNDKSESLCATLDTDQFRASNMICSWAGGTEVKDRSGSNLVYLQLLLHNFDRTIQSKCQMAIFTFPTSAESNEAAYGRYNDGNIPYTLR